MLPALLLLPVPGHVFGQDTAGVGSLTGKVNRAGRQPAASLAEPLAAVRVCLVELARCTTSDVLGDFRLSDIRSGIYSLEVQIAGEPPLRQSGVDIRAGLEARVDISVPDLGSVRQEVNVSDSNYEAP
ncbi:MAG: carboxypeptidase regulatory-like domain-containing protein, partial [Bryobacteraceae bacterium]|nr:carboxypeptidase regulatory-like domain-containing protein [Bryobacteraceae bacterium]